MGPGPEAGCTGGVGGVVWFWGERSSGIRTKCGEECCDAGRTMIRNQADGNWIWETLKAA